MAITKITLVESGDQMRKTCEGPISIIVGQNLKNATKVKCEKPQRGYKKIKQPKK